MKLDHRRSNLYPKNELATEIRTSSAVPHIFGLHVILRVFVQNNFTTFYHALTRVPERMTVGGFLRKKRALSNLSDKFKESQQESETRRSC